MNKVARDTEPWEPFPMGQLQNEAAPLTVINGTERMTWFPRRMDLPPLEGEHEANAERTWHTPAPARAKRWVDEGEWEPAPDVERVLWIVLAVVFGAPLLVWLWRTWL